uniref:YLP motif-containing protein 1 n=1 Tax=Oncorhynchus tshawytscha TaxID=74940 RepID=A0AAZ3PWC1_ONCTS
IRITWGQFGVGGGGLKSSSGKTDILEMSDVDMMLVVVIQEQQQYWYKQHLQNLQRLKAEKAKQGQGDGPAPPPPKPQPHSAAAAPPPPAEPPKNAPPPPPPKEEPPPPPPPDDAKVRRNLTDPVEVARLQQLQSAAAQWQQAQQQRAGYQYQALMQHHAQLQTILNQYQQCIQQPAQLETMSMAMQLSHYETQQKQFGPVFEDWGRTFSQWQEQFQSYPHKDQLQNYELQWKQWQEQMNSTAAHLQVQYNQTNSTSAHLQVQYNQTNSTSAHLQVQYNQTNSISSHLQVQYNQTNSISAHLQVQYNQTNSTSAHLQVQYNQTNSTSAHLQVQYNQTNSAHLPQHTYRYSTTRQTLPQHTYRTAARPLQCPTCGNPHRRTTPRPSMPRGNPPGSSTRAPGSSTRAPGSSTRAPGSSTRAPGSSTRAPGPSTRAPGPSTRAPGPSTRAPGPSTRAPGFDGPRGNGPRFDQQQSGQQQRFNAPPGPRFNQQHPRFDQLGPRGPGPRFGQQGPHFDHPPRQSPPARFERPPGPSAPYIGPQPKPDTGKDTKLPQGKTEMPAGSKPPGIKPTGQAKPVAVSTTKQGELAEPGDMSEDMLESLGSFFVQNDPIPQTKAEADAAAASKDSKKEEVTPPATNVSNNNGPPGPQGPKSHGPEPPKTDTMTNQPAGLLGLMGRGRGGRGQPLGPVRGEEDGGRGRGEADGGRGRGEGVPYDYRPPHEEMRSQHGGPEEDWQDWQQDPSLEKPEGPPLPEEEMWVPEEGEPLDGHHWEEADPPPPEYWGEEGDPYWMDRRPPPHGMRGGLRALFPPGRGRPPRGRPGFMHQGGPRRPLPPPHGAMDPHEPLGSPMGPDDDMDPLGPPLHRDYNPRGPIHHDMMERDMRGRPPPPREMMDRDLMGPGGHPPYHDMEMDPGWPPGPGRPPHLGMRRRPLGPRGAPMGRGVMRHPPRSLEDLEGYPHEGYGEGFGGPGDDGYGRTLPPRDWPDHPSHEYDCEEEYYPQEPPRVGVWDRERGGPLPERDYSPYPSRGPPPPPDRFRDDDRDFPDDPSYRHDERSYPSPAEWERPRPPLPERNYPPDFEDHSTGPDSSQEPASQGTGPGILALSQRQHEIILKAAQELKLIREMQENKTEGEALPITSDPKTELPAGLLGLEIPPEVRSALQVDLGAATVERISYGERIVLRPDPLPDRERERSYEKGEDPYHRDLYYDRRPVSPYMERREYSREREMYREKAPMDFEREPYERERYPPRDDRYTRISSISSISNISISNSIICFFFLLAVPSCGPGERRSYPEERGGGPTSSHPPPPPAAPPSRIEKKPETKNVEDLLKLPGRDTRPERIVIIMRGLPGSGKSHVAKLIRDKEVECGGAPPRVLGLDDYFMTEVEKMEKDQDTGKRVKLKCLEYEYEAEMEDTYRNSMLKTFRKTLDDGFFPFIIIDAINDRVKYFDQFWSAAKTKGFEVYLAEISADYQTCAKRNAHGRKMRDIQKMSSNWESSPRHMMRLDVRSLLQDAAIEEVEMEDFNPDDETLKKPKKNKEEEEEDVKVGPSDVASALLLTDKLDGLVMGGKRKREGDDFQLTDDYATRHSEPGKKRVRWADLEEQKDAERKRDIGFVVGQTDWEKITDQSGQIAQRALNRTKYF